MRLSDPVTKVPLVGSKFASVFEFLQIFDIRDLLYHFPVRFEDSSEVKTIADLSKDEKVTFKAKVIKIKSLRLRGGRSLQKGILEDDETSIEVVWFNQPYLVNNFKEGNWYLFKGKLNPKSLKPQIPSPEYERLIAEDIEDFKAFSDSNTHLGRITPIYGLTEGISSKWLRSRIKWIVDRVGKEFEIVEPLPEAVREKYNLVGINDALKWIHFPENEDQIEKARRRLGFDEMLAIQLRLEKRRRIRSEFNSPEVKIDKKLTERLLSAVEFKPTGAQVKTIDEIHGDLSRIKPMNRLLQGDVGSGKTLVALEAALQTAHSGLQTIILVPTSVLAEQHFKTFSSFLKNFNVSVQLVTGSTKKGGREGESAKTKTGNSDIIIGTHAILHRKSELIKNLGLVVIDEQHRFGVEQRRELLKDIDNLTENSSGSRKTSPHLLTMTATPIPRSLALSIFGDMEVSILDEMPEGRTSTKTFLVPDEKRDDAYKWIKEKVLKKNKIFWITPLIEESEKLETKSATETFSLLSEKIYPDLKIKLLHGKIKEEEKQKILSDFKAGKFNILVSTSVIEVGIDIPDAEVIVIEGAERFGLAQLHQLRGRVGRRQNESWCFLFTSTGEETDDQKERLKFFAKENDGLKIAEFDLGRRGPGEVYGMKQSGIPALKIAKFDDIKLIKETREAASILVS